MYAVIDTNILVSAQLTRHEDSATRQIVRAVFNGCITPVITSAILDEYQSVLSRPKFHIAPDVIAAVTSFFHKYGRVASPQPYSGELHDEKDRIFLEATLGMRSDDAVLVTGNKRHFPDADFILTPFEFIALYAPLM